MDLDTASGIMAEDLGLSKARAKESPAQARLLQKQDTKSTDQNQESVSPMAGQTLQPIAGITQPIAGTSHPIAGVLLSLIERAEIRLGYLPLPKRLLHCFQWWKNHAPLNIQNLLLTGVQSDLPLPQNMSWDIKEKKDSEIKLAREILEDYQKSGAVKKLSPEDGRTLHTIPWFIITKTEGNSEKHRLIADCRELNQFFCPKNFRLDHLQNIFPYLRKGQWAAKLDLKDAYFHLPLNQNLQSYVRMQVGSELWAFTGACFGLSTLPQIFMSVMRVLEKMWRKKGLQTFIYLDDILILGSTPNIVQHHLKIMVQDLLQAGFKINVKKSILQPTQQIHHLGFLLDFTTGHLKITIPKLKSLRKELGKLVTHTSMSCRKLAAILGTIRSCLVSAPFLRAFTDTLVQFTNQHQQHGWDKNIFIPQSLKTQLLSVKDLLISWEGRPFYSPHQREIHSDSSQLAWGALDLKTKQILHNFWREEKDMHINYKELLAATLAVQGLGKPKEHILLSVDNIVAYTYLAKMGGRIPLFNHIMRNFHHWLQKHQIHLSVQWVASKDMLADQISRWTWDQGDYTLHPKIFHLFFKRWQNFATPQ